MDVVTLLILLLGRQSVSKQEEDNPYIQAFHKWWESDLADCLEEIRITGGEPIMHRGTWKLFDWFEQNPDRGRNMRFAINSNLSPEKPKVLDKLIEKSWFVPTLKYTHQWKQQKNKQNIYVMD